MSRKTQIKHSKEVEEIATTLMDGTAKLIDFENLTVSDITSDARINHIYESANIENLSEFLKLGKARMELRNYGRRSEKMLRAAVESYLFDYFEDTNPTWKYEAARIDHEALIMSLKNGKRADEVVTRTIWKIVQEGLKETVLAERKILPTASELGMKWPIATKSSLSDKTIGCYLEKTPAELRKEALFGWKKVAVYTACALHLHKHVEAGANTAPKDAQTTVQKLWENSILTEKEKNVIELRYGVQERRKHTLTEIKEHYNVTRERIRQIENNALRKLRMGANYHELPRLLINEKYQVWERLTKEGKIKRAEWMEPLEDRLGAEYQIAIELTDYRKHRNPGTSALAEWLDHNFPNDETYWYRDPVQVNTKSDNQDQMNGGLMDFLDEL